MKIKNWQFEIAFIMEAQKDERLAEGVRKFLVLFFIFKNVYSFHFCCVLKEYKFRSIHQRCSVKNVFLEISQNLRENTCARASFLIKL